MILLWLAALASMASGSKAVPIAPGEWIGPNDYPTAALRFGASGVVGFELDVGDEGQVQACRIISSSGQALLDDATCNLLKVRAHFMPATDSATHKPVASVYRSRVLWKLPNAAQPSSQLFGPSAQALPVIQPLVGAVPASSWRPQRNGPIYYVDAEPSSADIMPVAPKGRAPIPDPTIHRGTLPNGLRYAIMHNSLRDGAVSMRMRVDVGSIDEDADQFGYAHLVEHMLFRGSAAHPDGELRRTLAKMGLKLGADILANTYYDATIYAFDFHATGLGETALGLSILRDMAARATFSPSALAAERGVVMAEERSVDDAARRAERARLSFLLPGQKIGEHPIIGTIESIASADAAGLRAFYARHYRPERTMIVVVGDIAPADVERELAAQFSDWAGTGEGARAADRGTFQPRGKQVAVHVEAGLSPWIELNWGSAFDPGPDGFDRERRDLGENIAALIFNERLSRAAENADAPFLRAGLSREDVYRSARMTSVAIQPADGQRDQALAATLLEQKRLVRDGVSREEMDRIIARHRAAMQIDAAGAATRDTGSLANGVLAAMVEGKILSTPAQNSLNYDYLVSTLDIGDINRAAARLFAGSGPLVYVTQAKPPHGGETALLAVLAALDKQVVPRRAGEALKSWPYASFGPIGTVSRRTDIADLGVTIIAFANGATATIKPSKLPRNRVLVDLNFGSGIGGLPSGLERSYWMAGTNTSPFVAGGLAKLSAADADEQMALNGVSVSFWSDEERFHLTGAAGTESIETQIQLLTAYIAEPGMRASATAKAKSLMATISSAYDASASLTMQRDVGYQLHGRDPRWSGFPDPADVAASDVEDLAKIFQPALAGPVNLTIVGDVSLERAILAAQATIGALPVRGPRPPARPVHFPTATSEAEVKLVHGRPDQSVALAAWATPGFFANSEDSRAMQILADILEMRLTDGLREKEGLTYSPSVFTDQSTLFASYGMIAAQVEIAPDKTEQFYSELAATLQDLAENGVSQDELDRARAPAVEQSKEMLRTTEYWLDALATVDEEPRGLDVIRTRLPHLMAVKPVDIQRLAKTYLAGKLPYRLIVRSVP